MRPERRTPAQLTPHWPDEASPDPDAEALRLVVVRLREIVGDTSLRQLARATGVAHAALGNILAGATWPDTRTLARLERGLKARLWPVIGAAGTHVATSSDVVVREGAEQVDSSRRDSGR